MTERDGSEGEQRRHRGWGAVAVLLLVLLAYVLSIGPAARWSRGASQRVEDFLNAIYWPVIWLMEHTPADRVIGPYIWWWIE